MLTSRILHARSFIAMHHTWTSTTSPSENHEHFLAAKTYTHHNHLASCFSLASVRKRFVVVVVCFLFCFFGVCLQRVGCSDGLEVLVRQMLGYTEAIIGVALFLNLESFLN